MLPLPTCKAEGNKHATTRVPYIKHQVGLPQDIGYISCISQLPQAADAQAQQDQPEGESNAGSRRMPSSAALARNS